jgi:hypothetical protein|tara:strand:- start:510 stop:845 length:336 start_codon:yes stop_codon:yes gene_type:complete
MFKLDKLKIIKRALSSSFFLTKETNMVKSNTTGSKFFRVGSQNQQILANYWGTGKTFTLEGLTDKLDAMSPGARVHEIRESGFNVKSTPIYTGEVGRPALKYSISRRRVFA